MYYLDFLSFKGDFENLASMVHKSVSYCNTALLHSLFSVECFPPISFLIFTCCTLFTALVASYTWFSALMTIVSVMSGLNLGSCTALLCPASNDVACMARTSSIKFLFWNSIIVRYGSYAVEGTGPDPSADVEVCSSSIRA